MFGMYWGVFISNLLYETGQYDQGLAIIHACCTNYINYDPCIAVQIILFSLLKATSNFCYARRNINELGTLTN
jgi:hypothetical protein